LETYFILEELGAPSNYLMWQQMKKWLTTQFCKLINAVKVSGRTEKD
jgi:hypothetical protein